MPPTNREALIGSLQAEYESLEQYLDELARAIACFTGGAVMERRSTAPNGRGSAKKADVETALFSLLSDNPLGIEKGAIVDLVTEKVKEDRGTDGKGIGKFMKGLLQDPRVTLGDDDKYRLLRDVQPNSLSTSVNGADRHGH
jgi:hypothetical protein